MLCWSGAAVLTTFVNMLLHLVTTRVQALARMWRTTGQRTRWGQYKRSTISMWMAARWRHHWAPQNTAVTSSGGHSVRNRFVPV